MRISLSARKSYNSSSSPSDQNIPDENNTSTPDKKAQIRQTLFASPEAFDFTPPKEEDQKALPIYVDPNSQNNEIDPEQAAIYNSMIE